MAFDLSKIKKSTTTTQTTTTATKNVSTGFVVSATSGETYDLDQIIYEKLRDNSEAALVIQNTPSEELRNKLIELVTKKILDDYGVQYNDTNYKQKVKLVPSFSVLFDRYYTKYYDEYSSLIKAQAVEGSISIDTVLRKIDLTKEEVKNYTLADVEADQSSFLSFDDKNRPLIIWTDGTEDPGVSDISEDVMYKSDFSRYLKDAIESSDNRISVSETDYGVDLTLNNTPTDEDLSNLDLKINKQIETTKEVLSELEYIKTKGLPSNGTATIETVDEIQIKNGKLATDSTAVPSVNAIYKLFASFLSGMGASVKTNTTDNSLVLNPFAQLDSTTETYTLSMLDTVTFDGEDYILTVGNINSLSGSSNSVKYDDDTEGYVLPLNTGIEIDAENDYFVEISEIGMIKVEDDEYVLALD